MVKTAWVTDSTAYLDDELSNHPDLYTIPLTVVLDEEEYLDGIDLTPKELFGRLKELKNPPLTSQPSVGSFQSLYEQLSKEYDQIVTILISGKLSGTVSSSKQAAALVDIPVTTFDSHILTYPMSALIKKGMELVRNGKSIESMVEQLEQIRETCETYVLVGSLEQLHRGGRMSGLQFFLGSMLNVKPIISIEDGALGVKEKVRGEKKAKEKILDYFRLSYEQNRFKEVYLLYGLHEEQAKAWQIELQEKYPDVKIFSCPLGAVIGVHAGENTLGISWFNGLK
ncbi:DegV family protein with EDD domain [Neobacillus bataviensis]|uniref:DegV family protein with EDD domain n=1 Tax=Neobacillus bataviensis TaxID=220685 RepID=A0A561DRZ7_9BACI|nr:DegV family protein [Neobacillus bataviensis]TWE06110.1 DegV family protein with EDD domain [Neobacillus bataviensis]